MLGSVGGIPAATRQLESTSRISLSPVLRQPELREARLHGSRWPPFALVSARTSSWFRSADTTVLAAARPRASGVRVATCQALGLSRTRGRRALEKGAPTGGTASSQSRQESLVLHWTSPLPSTLPGAAAPSCLRQPPKSRRVVLNTASLASLQTPGPSRGLSATRPYTRAGRQVSCNASQEVHPLRR
jgi:hypothetical protein